MASIVLRNYGGMAPSANAKSLPENSAVYARNLDLRFGDFRPLPVAESVATVTAGATLYRFDGSGQFTTSTSIVSYVRGPIPTDATERTYYTGDGVPKVTDLTGAVRQLGVPKPGSAPAVSVNEGTIYSSDDQDAAVASAATQFASIVTANVTRQYEGLDSADWAATSGATANAWAFKYNIAGSMVSGAFVPTNAAHRVLIDDRLGFYLETAGATTTGHVDLFLRGQTAAIGAGMATAMAGVLNPVDGSALMTTAQRTAATTALADALKPANDAKAVSIGRLRDLHTQFVAIASGGSGANAASVAAMKAFYLRTDVAGAITDAVEAAANTVINAMNTFNRVDP